MRHHCSIYPNIISKLITSLILGVMFIVPNVHSGTLSNEFIEKPGEVSSQVMNNSIKFKFDNGTVLRLFEIKDKREVTLGFIIRESSQVNAQRISQHTTLKRSSPVDMLWGVTAVGTRIPDELLAYFGEPDRRKQQGWARVELGLTDKPSEGMGANCNDYGDFSGFSNDILDFGYGLVFLSDNDGPQSKPQHWFDDPYYDEDYYFRLTGAAYDVQAFYAQVRYCFVDDYTVEDHGDPWWGYDYRVAGGQWENIDGANFGGAGDQDSFWWHPVESTWGLPGGQALDFRIRIGRTLPGSLFRIGATWSKPFDTLSPN